MRGEVVNIAYGESTEVRTLVSMIAEILGVDDVCDHEDARPGDVARSCADITLARETIGYEPHVDLREGLERTLADRGAFLA